MKFSLALTGSAVAAILTPVLGCIHASGDIWEDDFGGIAISASLTDNGATVCSTGFGSGDGWYIDHDDHYSINCIAGYVYAFTQDGQTAWYGYPGSSFSWHQPTSETSDFCNPPQSEWCFTTTWSVNEYC